MKDDVVYTYGIIVLFLSFISVLPFAPGSFGGLVVNVFSAALFTLLFNPISWAVYYVAGTRRASFKHMDLLVGYEAVLVIFAMIIGHSVFGGPFGFTFLFILANLAFPVSWFVIFISINRGRNVVRRYQYQQRNPANASPSMAGQASSMASAYSNPGAQASQAYQESAGVQQPAAQGAQIQQPATPQRAYQQTGNFGDDVTLVGYVGGGKTTFTALFVYACQFIRGIPNFRFVMEESSTVVRTGLEQLLSGEWPSLTLRSESRTRTKIALSRKKGLSSRRVNLTINDVSGEIWREVAEHSENPGPRLSQLIRENPSVISLQRAAKYLVTVNCSDFDKWDSEQLYILDLFRAIRAINGGRKVRKPTAVILTKIDLLPQSVQEKSPEEIMRTHLPFVYSYLEEHYDSRSFNFFKVGLKVNEFSKPDVTVESGKKKLTIIGGGSMGAFPEIVRWMLSD